MKNKIGKVMLVDDNEIDLTINSKIITLSNLFEEIIMCQSGQQAVEYITKNLENKDKLPQIILLDIQMPEMDGFEFLEIYKNFPASFLDSCQIAILSSTLDFGDIKKSEANPLVVKLLKKPLYTTELSELLKRELC